MKNIIFILTFNLLLLTCFSTCLYSEPGARPQALGGAYVGICDDINSVWWNPAGLSKIRWEEISIIHSFEKREKTYCFSYLQPGDNGNTSYGTGLSYYQPYSNTDDYDFLTGFFYSQKVSERINSGVKINFLQQKNRYTTKDRIVLDFGMLSKTNIPGLTLGSAIKNIGNNPIRVAIGCGYKHRTDFTIVSDIVYEDKDFSLNFGIEYWIRFLAIRSGYTTKGKASYGLGVGRKSDFRFDYSYTSERLHNLAIVYSFGRFEPKRTISEIEEKLYYAKKEYYRGNIIEAAKIFKDVLWFDNDNKEAKEYLAKIETKKNQFLIEKQISFGKTFFNQKDWFNSKEKFEIVLLLDSNNETAKRYLEMVDLKFSQMKEAERFFAEGKFFYERNDYEKAFALFEKVLELNPENTEADRYLRLTTKQIELKKQKEEKDKAKQVFEEAVLLFNTGQINEAYKKFKEIKQTDLYNDEVNIYISRCEKNISDEYCRSGIKKYDDKKYLEAIEDFKKTNSLNQDGTVTKEYLKKLKNKADEFYILGKKEYSKKNVKAAIKNWEIAIKLNPEHKEAKSALERVRNNKR